ncbi:MAG: hypothetical protein ACD_75C00848G0002 [uncultured bacterium]|nr:MAG: hypothetical protein ACD_75C00848G0002 [uncultured bacterium]
MLDETAERGNLGHAGHAFERQLDIIVLERAQLGEILLAAFVDHGIGETPADAGRIGAQHRIDVGRQLAPHRLQIFEDPAACPVDVGPFLENRIDEGTALVGEAADHLDLGGGKEGRGDRVGDLVLDQVGRPPHPFGENDDLGFAEIGNGIERRAGKRPPAPAGEKRDHQENQKTVAGALFNEPRNHYCTSPFSLASESMRKLASTATLSPAVMPSVTSIMPSALIPVVTSRGSKAPPVST